MLHSVPFDLRSTVETIAQDFRAYWAREQSIIAEKEMVMMEAEDVNRAATADDLFEMERMREIQLRKEEAEKELSPEEAARLRRREKLAARKAAREAKEAEEREEKLRAEAEAEAERNAGKGKGMARDASAVSFVSLSPSRDYRFEPPLPHSHGAGDRSAFGVRFAFDLASEMVLLDHILDAQVSCPMPKKGPIKSATHSCLRVLRCSSVIRVSDS